MQTAEITLTTPIEMPKGSITAEWDNTFLQQMLTVVTDQWNNGEATIAIDYLRKMLVGIGIDPEEYDYCEGSGPKGKHAPKVSRYVGQTCAECGREWGE